MKISLDWVSDFVDLSGIPPELIADRLTLCTAEVEGFEVLQRSVEGVVVAEVVEANPLAEQGDGGAGARLTLATVDCGRVRYVTVCGAPNVRVGMKAAFAPPGVTLANGARIGVSELAGHRSEGVLCSAMELGMSRWHEVILECPGSVANGAPLADFVPPQDVIIEIDNKSLTHRPDLWGHYAFARELSAIFGRDLRALPMAELSRYDRLPAYPLSVEAPEGCPCYGCLEFRVAGAIPSPLRMQRRLHALGQRTYNLLVDVTNYVMLELAQPTHAFDGQRVQAIRVATLGRPGTFVTLDGQQRALLADDLLIWNQSEPVALAGVMGGLNSEVQPTTTKVLLESANFKGSRIRRTSVRLDLRTESAQRFEKNQPPVNVKLAVARILKLVEEAGAQPVVTSRFTVAGDLKDKYRTIRLSRSLLRAMAGKEIPDDEVGSILDALGFDAEFSEEGRIDVGVPPHRSDKDISLPADIIEEVLRIYGYDKIEPHMPVAPLKPVFVSKPLRVEHKVRRLLAQGHRFLEVHNYGWFDDRWLAEIGFEPAGALVLKNPIAQHCRLMRTTLVPNLLALVRPNRVHRDAFRLFELGRVYRLRDDGQCEETTRLAGVSFHQMSQPAEEEHFRAIKAALEDVARVAGGEPLRFQPAPQGHAPWELPNRWAAVDRGGRRIGGLGVLAGPILEAVAHEGQVVWFDLAMDALDGPIYPELKYQEAPKYPGSWQDFSLVWDLAQGFAALDSRLDQFSHPLVRDREFLYVYKGKGLAPGKASYSFRYWLGAWDRTLTADEIEQFRHALLAFLDAQGISLR